MIPSVRQGLEDTFACRWFINMVSLLLALLKYPQAMGRIQSHWVVPGLHSLFQDLLLCKELHHYYKICLLKLGTCNPRKVQSPLCSKRLTWPEPKTSMYSIHKAKKSAEHLRNLQEGVVVGLFFFFCGNTGDVIYLGRWRDLHKIYSRSESGQKFALDCSAMETINQLYRLNLDLGF